MDQNTKRLAVVIGNSDYQNLTSLANSANDANAVKEALHSLGYEVSLKFNLQRNEILNCFTKVLDPWKDEASEIVIYFSGHGISIDGKAYIAPVDADNDVSKDLIRKSFFSVKAIVKFFLNHRKDNKYPIILIFDCCRSKIISNITRSHDRVYQFQSVGEEFGTKSNIAILYSTAEGEAALDGDDESFHSPYTQILLENIAKDMTISEINSVITRTLGESRSGSKQVSWISQCLHKPYKFRLPKLSMNSQEFIQMPHVSNNTIVHHFYGVPARNQNFINRPKIISKIEAFLSEKPSINGGNILVLKGLGGMGKTQLMLQYCYLHHLEYDYAFWLEADGRITTLDSFRKLAINLGLDEEIVKENYSEEKIISLVCTWLEKRTRWLLLLDNVDEVMATKLFKFLPRIGGDIILTTREHIPSTKANVIPVYKMDENEAFSLLLNTQTLDIMEYQTEKYGKEIVAELDSMPLAISLACAYINNMQISFRDYLDMLKNQRDELFSHYDEDNSHQYNHTLTTVWKLSFERIRSIDLVARLILDMCSFLQPDAIPVKFFEQQYSSLEDGSTFFSNSENNKNSKRIVRAAISILVKFSFVTRTLKEGTGNEGEFLAIHRLVQKVIFNEMNDEQKIRFACNIAKALNNETKFSDQYATTTRKMFNTYLSHIRHFIILLNELHQNPLLSTDLEDLLVRTVSYLLDNGIYTALEIPTKLALSVSESIHGEDSLSITLPLNLLGLLYEKRGEYTNAEPLYQRALIIREKALGSEHPYTATSLNNLASLYFNQGKYTDAEPLYQRGLIICEKALGPEHLKTATSLNNLASLYDNQGKYIDAEPLYKRALVITEKALGSEHPCTATSLNNLASLYFNQGKCTDVEPLYQRALIIRKKTLGSEHPATAGSLNNFASFYNKQSKYADAEQLYQQALIIKEKTLGLEHPDVAVCLSNLASLYNKQGKYTDAEPQYQRALIIKEKILGPEHPDTATSLSGLALLYCNQHKYADAEPLFQRALLIRDKTLGPDHPDTTIVLNNMISVYIMQKKFSNALPLFKRVLMIDNVLESVHLNAPNSLNMSTRSTPSKQWRAVNIFKLKNRKRKCVIWCLSIVVALCLFQVVNPRI